MDRLEAFEAMLAEIQKQAEKEELEMNRLKSEGKTKTVTYRQYFANKQTFNRIFDNYRKHGLID